VRRVRPLELLVAALVLGAVARGATARPASAGGKATLRVFAAASLSDTFKEIDRMYEQRHPGTSVQLNLAGSQQLVAQIEQGAEADVFASADDRWMNVAHDRGLLGGSAMTFARNRLVAIVPKSNPARIRRLQDLARGGIRFVTCPDAVPVGHYTRIVLGKLSHQPGFDADYWTRVIANIVSEEENVKSVAGKVQIGEADAGIVYRSDVTPSLTRYVRVLEIPEAANVMASYPIATLRSAARPEDAAAFVDLVQSPDGQRILARWGFIPAATP
jgi:molybdate transport system substrate-binding protein